MPSDTAIAGTLLREARRRAGLTQRDLARRAGVAQSVISAYESGGRQPALPTLLTLVRATGHEVALDLAATETSTSRLAGPLGRRVARHRDAMHEAVARHGGSNLRVFGSVARGDERLDSDIDVLVDLPPNAGLFTLLRLKAELEAILDAPVEVIPADSLRPDVRTRVEHDLVAL